MAEFINFYKFLHDNHQFICIRIPPTIVIGCGFDDAYKFYGSLRGEQISKSEVPGLLKQWDCSATVKKHSSTFTTHDLEQLQSFISSDCLIQKYEPLSIPLSISWSKFFGISFSEKDQISRCKTETSIQHRSIEAPLGSFRDRKQLLELVKYISRKLPSELKFIEFEGLKVDGKIFYTAIKHYKTMLKVSKFPSQKVLEPLKTVVKTRMPRRNTRKSTTFRNPARTALNEEVQGFMKDYPTLKHMRLSTIMNKIKNSEALLPNEMLFQKTLAAMSSKILVETSESSRKIKRMITAINKNKDLDLGQEFSVSDFTKKVLGSAMKRTNRLEEIEYLDKLGERAGASAVNAIEFANRQLQKFKNGEVFSNR